MCRCLCARVCIVEEHQSTKQTHDHTLTHPRIQQVEWTLSSEIGSDFTFDNESAKFYDQHAVTQNKDGDLILFDNGNARTYYQGGTNFSRGLVLTMGHAQRSDDKKYRLECKTFSTTYSYCASMLAQYYALTHTHTQTNPSATLLFVNHHIKSQITTI